MPLSPLPSFSLAVTDPETFEALKQGRIGGEGDIVVVDWDAHPNVISLPVEFAHIPFNQISFVGKPTEFGSNTITLFPQRRQAGATFSSEENATHGIPPNYAEYLLTFYKGSIVFTDDLDYILQWKEATRLEIYDEVDNDVAFQFSQRVNDLSALVHLEKLVLNIHRDTYELLNLSAFLEKLSALIEARFYAKNLSFVEVFDYTKSHLTGVSFWECKAHDGYGRPFIHCVGSKNLKSHKNLM